MSNETIGRARGLAALAMFAGIFASAGAPAEPAANAQYTLEFAADWSAQTHPTNFPGNAHFSGMVGGTHRATVEFWAVGALASQGIKRMAETGSKTNLIDEVEASIDAGEAEFVLSGDGIGTSPGGASMDFSLSQAFDLVTVVSMIAPSPDWFIGVAGLDLFVDDAWVDELTVALYPYDAGTDSGTSYNSSNQATNPPEPIVRIGGDPFLNLAEVAPLGTFTFTRVPDPNEDTDDDLVPDLVDNCLLVPNEDQRNTNNDSYGNACDADLNNDCQTDFDDLVLLKTAFFGNGPDEDFDGDGAVNFNDLSIAKELFFSPPGPSDAGDGCDAE